MPTLLASLQSVILHDYARNDDRMTCVWPSQSHSRVLLWQPSATSKQTASSRRGQLRLCLQKNFTTFEHANLELNYVSVAVPAELVKSRVVQMATLYEWCKV